MTRSSAAEIETFKAECINNIRRWTTFGDEINPAFFNGQDWGGWCEQGKTKDQVFAEAVELLGLIQFSQERGYDVEADVAEAFHRYGWALSECAEALPKGPVCLVCHHREAYHDNYSIWRGCYVCANPECRQYGLPDDTTPEQAAEYDAAYDEWKGQYDAASPEARFAMGALYDRTCGGLFSPDEALAIVGKSRQRSDAAEVKSD